MSFFSTLATQIRSEPLKFGGSVLGLLSQFGQFQTARARGDTASNIVALNLQQQKALLPKQKEFIGLKRESLKDAFEFSKEEAEDFVERSKQDAKRTIADIQRAEIAITGGVSVRASLDVADYLNENLALSRDGADLVKAGGRIAEITKQIETAIGERRAAKASGGVRASSTDTTDIERSGQRALDELSVRLADLNSQREQAQQDLQFAKDRFADELTALRNNLDNDLRRLKNEEKQLEIRAAAGIATSEQQMDDIDAEMSSIAGSAVLKAVGIAIDSKNPIGAALKAPINSLLKSFGFGGSGGAGAAAGAGGAASGAGAASSAPFSSFGGPGMQGIGSSIASQAAAAGSIGGPAGFSANLAAGGLTPASGIGGTGGIAGSAGGAAGAGIAGAAVIGLPAAFVAGKVLSRLAGADSTKPQMFMGIEGVRQYDPDFEFTGDDEADLKEANRIAFLAAAPKVAGEFQQAKISAKEQQRFGLGATVSAADISKAAETSLGAKIRRGMRQDRLREISNIGGGGGV